MPVELTIKLIILAIGACFGSFITAASWRLPREQDVVVGASKCPKCGHRLGFFDLIPVFSWFFSGGKCRHCKARVSSRYVITEVVTALIFLGLYERFGLNSQSIILALLATSMLILIISDFETYIIPDSTTISAFILAIIYHYIIGNPWTDFVLGFIACLVVALTLRYGFYFIKKREALGMGDVKFLPVAGLWIGLSALPVYFILAGLTGIVTAIFWRIIFKNPEYPFGPALAIAMYIIVIFPQIAVLN